MRGLMFESIRILLYIGILNIQTWAMIRGDDTKFAFRSHEKFDYKAGFPLQAYHTETYQKRF